MATLNFQINKASECGYLLVEDITSWGSTEREEYGLAMFVASGLIGSPTVDDPNLADLGNPGTNSLAAAWTITTENLRQYDVTILMCPIWDDQTSYSATDVVYHNGLFWIAGTVIAGDEPGVAGKDWTELTSSDWTSFDTAGNIDKLTQSERTVCSPYSFSKTACHEYSLELLQDNGGIWVYGVYDVENTIITSPDTDIAYGTPVTISTTQDGVYYVVLQDTTNSLNYTFPIYDFCTTLTCLSGMIKSILCVCDDPCEEAGCDDATSTRYRDEINRIIALYYPLIGMVNADYVQHIGIFEIDEDRMEWMTTISDMIARLNVIANRCGVCDGEEDVTTNGCDC